MEMEKMVEAARTKLREYRESGAAFYADRDVESNPELDLLRRMDVLELRGRRVA